MHHHHHRQITYKTCHLKDILNLVSKQRFNSTVKNVKIKNKYAVSYKSLHRCTLPFLPN